jgi:DNA (cytosine-5)-methyltransferase 1
MKDNLEAIFKMNYLDMFSGIGGFALGAAMSGTKFENHYFSEVNEYAINVYKEHFPAAIALGDARQINYRELPRGDWIVTGGFSCQLHSNAGRRNGENDERDLWAECERVLRELRPRIALFENVPAITLSNGGRFFNRVLSDISTSGYDAEWKIISASSIGAPHRRDRLWIVCYSVRCGCEGEFGRRTGAQFADGYKKMERDISYPAGQRLQKRWFTRRGLANVQGHCGWAVEPCVGRVAYGVPKRVDRIKGLGNSIVPHIAQTLFDTVFKKYGFAFYQNNTGRLRNETISCR